MPDNQAPSLAFDHMVIAVADLEAAMSAYASLGFTVRYGGQHPGRRTHNALITFAEGNYLELIAERSGLPPTSDAREAWVRDAVQSGQALLTFALRSPNLAATVARCEERGLPFSALQDGARERPDGARVAWRAASPSLPDLPFLIEDVSARELRISEAAEDVTHANGAKGLRQVELLAGDVAEVAASHTLLLGHSARQEQGAALFSLGEVELRIRAPAHERERTELGEAAARLHALTLNGEEERELDAAQIGYPLRILAQASR
ncbi:MAG: VOC family protein [Anaerolineaceae bacterium]|nr:VOC family protein [Anaerolineaceae bacterium]